MFWVKFINNFEYQEATIRTIDFLKSWPRPFNLISSSWALQITTKTDINCFEEIGRLQ